MRVHVVRTDQAIVIALREACAKAGCSAPVTTFYDAVALEEWVTHGEDRYQVDRALRFDRYWRGVIDWLDALHAPPVARADLVAGLSYVAMNAAMPLPAELSAAIKGSPTVEQEDEWDRLDAAREELSQRIAAAVSLVLDKYDVTAK